jgi:hypothetical protein
VKPSLVPLAAVLLIFCLTAPLALAFPEYYGIPDLAKAQAEARQRNLPLAWLGSFREDLAVGAPEPGSVADLTQMALATLQGNAVVVFFDGRNMDPVPALIHAQFHLHDDAPLSGAADWISPKVVFSNADVSKILGRVSYTQMKAERDVPLNSAIQVIRNDPTALVAAPASADAVIVKAYGLSATQATDSADVAVTILTLINADGVYLAIGAVVVVVFLAMWIVSARRR